MIGGLAAILPVASTASGAALDYSIAPIPVADGIWMIAGVDAPILPDNGGAIANIAIIATTAGTVLVDSGPSLRYGRALKRAAEALTGKPVVRVYVTHLHPDHGMGIAAFDPETGTIKWHYQTTPHDGWDFDGVNEFIPFDATIGGKPMKLGAKADRNGYFFVLDRTNGKFVSANKFVMQTTWANGYSKDGKPNVIPTGRPGAAQGTEKGTTVFSSPSFLGGKNWMPMAYSKDTGLFYIPSNDWGMDIWNEPIAYKKGAAYLGAGFTIKPIAEDHIGALRAMDPKTGQIVWEYKNKAPLWGGVLTTAGNLVFTGTPEGYLKAFDAKTGQELWKFQTGSGVVGSPVTWEQDGEQYVAVMSGWGGAVPLWGGEVAKSFKDINQGGSLWVFKLPKN
jgi:alcohol dehydrogenase (cytochrome c)